MSNSLAARASSSSTRREDLLVHVAERHLDRPARAVLPLVLDLLRVPRRRADEHLLELACQATGTELDHGVPLRLALGVDDVDDDRVADLRRTAFGGRKLGNRLAQRFDLGVDSLLRHLDLLARHLERRPVDDLGERLDLDRRRERPRLVRRARELELELRVGDRAHAVAGRGAPEPPADVAVDGLGVDPLLAEA